MPFNTLFDFGANSLDIWDWALCLDELGKGSLGAHT